MSASTTVPVESAPSSVPTGGTKQNGKQQQSISWVQFEEDSEQKEQPAVLNTTENVQVNLDHNNRTTNGATTITTASDQPVVVDTTGGTQLRTIELGNNEIIRQGFVNGDVVVTLLPVNTKWPWITPAQFRPELVPEELMAQGLTLTVEEYVSAMELLVNDVRFTMYNICYKRVLVVWIFVAFTVLLGLLFSRLQGLILFSLGVAWLLLNASAIFLCMWCKIKLQKGLEKCLANVNKQLLPHKLILALDDRGKISCHKVNLCFLYLDPTKCIQHLQQSIDQMGSTAAGENGWEQRMDLQVTDIVIQGTQTTRLSRKQERATLLYLRYASRWGKLGVRGLITFPTKPARHCPRIQCPCQFIEEHLHYKPQGNCCFYMAASNNMFSYI